jgi:hypothetical protein
MIFDSSDNTYKELDKNTVDITNISINSLGRVNNYIKKWCNY